MPIDYGEVIVKLQAKADAVGVTDAERRTLLDKIAELREKYPDTTKPKTGAFSFTILPPTSRPSRRYDDWLDDIVDTNYLYDDE